MKLFILKILYFLLPLIGLAIPLDISISYFLSQSNQYPGEFEVWNDIYNSNAECDIAIYGSSRAWVHIDPEIISDTLNCIAYNFGIDGHNFWLQYLRHLELLKHNKKPKVIILSVDIFSLQKQVNLYQLDQFLPNMLWNNNIEKYTSSYIGYNMVDYYIPLIRYGGKSQVFKIITKLLINGRPKERYRSNGFVGMNKKWNTDFEIAIVNQKSYKIKLDQQIIELFENFIQECKNMDIDLILVYTPEYIEGQKFVLNRMEVFNVFKFFSMQYDLTFYDYSNDEICLDKNLFYNASHLNKKGANIFTKKFAGDLKVRTHNRLEGSSHE